MKTDPKTLKSFCLYWREFIVCDKKQRQVWYNWIRTGERKLDEDRGGLIDYIGSYNAYNFGFDLGFPRYGLIDETDLDEIHANLLKSLGVK